MPDAQHYKLFGLVCIPEHAQLSQIKQRFRGQPDLDICLMRGGVVITNRQLPEFKSVILVGWMDPFLGQVILLGQD